MQKKGDNTRLWNEVRKYIEETYDVKKIKRIYLSGDENILGCSAEGHVSHVLSSRMSSRPMGWTIEVYKALSSHNYKLWKNNAGNT